MPLNPLEIQRIPKELKPPKNQGRFRWFAKSIIDNPISSDLYSGPCGPEEEAGSGRMGFALIQADVIYWWCQYT
jgi:hypothetical protein